MLEGLLNCGHEIVRGNTFKFGERLAKSANGQGHLHLLEMLHNLDFADKYPHHCTEYYLLLKEILRTIPASPSQVPPGNPASVHPKSPQSPSGCSHLASSGHPLG